MRNLQKLIGLQQPPMKKISHEEVFSRIRTHLENISQLQTEVRMLVSNDIIDSPLSLLQHLFRRMPFHKGIS